MRNSAFALITGVVLFCHPASAQLSDNIIAGAGPADGSAATTISIADPGGMAVDTAGYVYYSSLCRIFRITPAGIVSTFAGTGRCVNTGDRGPLAAAQFPSLAGLHFDAAGNLYISDASGLRRVSGGMINSVAGPNSGLALAGMSSSLATDANTGTVYFVGVNSVYRLWAGVSVPYAGVGYSDEDNIYPGDARLGFITSIATDQAGRLYIADAASCRIRKVTWPVITTVAGRSCTAAPLADGSGATSGSIGAVSAIVFDKDGSLLFAAEGRVRRITNGVVSTVAGNGTPGYSGDGLTATAAQVSNDIKVLAVAPSGTLYILEWNLGRARIRKVADGIITTFAGNGSYTAGDGGPSVSSQLRSVASIATDSSGVVYIADEAEGRVRKIANGAITTVAGNGALKSSGNGGPALKAGMTPSGVVVDGSGNLLVLDNDSRTIRKVAGGQITAFAGGGATSPDGSGDPATDPISWPVSMTTDAQSVYVAANGLIRKITGGVLTTLAGAGPPDGATATDVFVGQPLAVALDGSGNAWFTTFMSHLWRRE